MGHRDPAHLLRALAKSDRRRRRERTPRRSERLVPRPRRGEPTIGGTVVAVHRGRCEVAFPDDTVLLCHLDPAVRTVQRTGLAVGDSVVVATEHAIVRRVAPRHTTLSRHNPHSRHLQRVICANVDRVLIVAALTDPPLRPRLVDRYLVAVAAGGAEPALVLTKRDRVPVDELEAALAQAAPYRSFMPVHVVSCITGEGIPALASALADQMVACVGHSGVGKSSLVVALGGTAVVGSVTDHRGRGAHTTRSSRLHRVPGGIVVVDTPGVRQFAPWGLDARTLREAFPDIVDAARRCEDRWCSHGWEPGCALPDAVEDGRLAAARLDSWRRLHAATDTG